MLGFLIHSAVEDHARTTPDRTAMSFRGRTLTYRELDEASNQLAHALLQRGLEPQGRVGIFMHKALELGPALYGILKAGGAFVPLDPLMPADRLAFIVKDCDIRHIVSADDKRGILTALAASLDADRHPVVYGLSSPHELTHVSWSDTQQQPTTAPVLPTIDQELAYIMYTSGSTGTPKGMMHTHHGSLSYARWGALHFGLTASDRVASHAPLHFDLSIFDFFSTSQAGAAVVLVPDPITKFPASWTQYIDDERISVVFTVPFTLIEMMERGVMEQRSLASLRWILFGGEPFPPRHLRALMQRLPNVRFTNVYGPAEAPSCTCYDIPADFDDSMPLPIGTVSRNSADLIVDDDDQACPVGVPGELLIRSSTLTKGYWNRPDLNGRIFFDRPRFGPLQDRYYRTGDLAVLEKDGLLRFLGRKDRMIKTRGHRVELDEVEAVLASHPGVLEAAAYAVPDEHGTRAIQAAVTLKRDASTERAAAGTEEPPVSTEDLTRHLRSKLPAYALPRAIDILETFPRTTSGKIDRRKLGDGHR